MSDTRRAVLETALSLIEGDRAVQYGDALDTHKRIAAIWNALLPMADIGPSDVALMLLTLKSIRAVKNPQYQDSWVDIAGYAALGAEFAGAE